MIAHVTRTTFLPVINIQDAGAPARIRRGAVESGFFYIIGHGVDERLELELMLASRAFFAREPSDKLKIRMELGGRAWRGYFPAGAELTSGIADQKEGPYFGAELDESHPKVRTKTPLHGRNLFPEDSDLGAIVLDYMDAMSALGRRVMEIMALSLGLEVNFFPGSTRKGLSYCSGSSTTRRSPMARRLLGAWASTRYRACSPIIAATCSDRIHVGRYHRRARSTRSLRLETHDGGLAHGKI